MTRRRIVTADQRSRFTLGAKVAPPGTSYRIVVSPNRVPPTVPDGTITLIPVEILDSFPGRRR